MKLKIYKRIADGRAHLGKFPAFVNEASEQMEAVVKDTIQIDELHYARQQGVLQLWLVLGGHDSKGKFHPDPKTERATVNIHRDRKNDAGTWDEFGLEAVDSFDWKTLKRLVRDKKYVQAAALHVWKIPDVIVELEQ